MHSQTMSHADEKKVTLCHISDFHLPITRSVPPHRLAGKRFFGYANLRFNRSRTHRQAHLESLLNRMTAEAPDLVVVTGDLTSLSLEFEFEEIDLLLKRCGLKPKKTLLIPGNHDRYTPMSDIGCAFEKRLSAWFPEGFSRVDGYPIARRLGPALVVALDTAVWRSTIRSAGRIARDQIDRLSALLESGRARGEWPVIAMHHPPFRLQGPFMRNFRSGVDGLDLFREAIADSHVTVIHGHLHCLSRRKVGNIDAIGVPSASNNTGKERNQIAYHVYEIGRGGLLSARAVRYWPDIEDQERRFESVDIPG